MSLRHLATCLAVTALLTGCSGGEKANDALVQQSPSETPAGPAINLTKPVVTVPKGPPPTKLQVRDIVVGTGARAFTGQKATVQYVGVHYNTGKQFDASWDSNTPFTFTVGGQDVIAGWDEGVVGMRVGGRRELIIPPDLGYGDKGTDDGTIKPGETLVFVVDMVRVGAPAT